jgi:hypothetical protein
VDRPEPVRRRPAVGPRPLRLAAAAAILALALAFALIALPRDRATATRPSGIAAELSGPDDVNLTRNETGAVTGTVVTFLLPVGAPTTVDAPAPRHCPL